MTHIVVVQKSRPNMGRNSNQTYVNVLTETREISQFASLADWVVANPTHPWNNIQFNEFVIEITETEYIAFRDGSNPLTYDGNTNQPRWQQQNTGTEATKSFGSWADPQDNLSVWLTTPIDDTRFIIRIYDNDPVTVGVHVAIEEFDEDAGTPTRLRYLKLFNSNDTPSGTDAQNQRTEIGGRLMDFDFTDGVATFSVAVDVTGDIVFPSNHRYRIIGPLGEKEYSASIFGKVLRVVQ